MPALYVGRRVYYFPLALSKSEYLVFAGVASQGKLAALESLVTYRDKKEEAAIRQCVFSRIQDLGFEVVKAFPSAQAVVMKRTLAR